MSRFVQYHLRILTRRDQIATRKKNIVVGDGRAHSMGGVVDRKIIGTSRRPQMNDHVPHNLPTLSEVLHRPSSGALSRGTLSAFML